MSVLGLIGLILLSSVTTPGEPAEGLPCPKVADPDGGVIPPEVIRDSMVMPRFPEEARRLGLSWEVLLRLLIDPEGKTCEVEFVRTSLPPPLRKKPTNGRP